MQRLTVSARKRPNKLTCVLRLGLPSSAHALRMAGRVQTPPTMTAQEDDEKSAGGDIIATTGNIHCHSWGRWTRI